MLIPPGAVVSHVQVSAGRLRVLLGGDPASQAVPLLLIHGGGSDNSAISWFRAFEPLATERRVVAADLPGFGGSMGLDAIRGPAPMADLLVEVLDALDLDRVVVCGVSMGGDVAMNLALRHPARVRGLILIAPGGLVASLGRGQRAAWLASRLPDRILRPLARFAGLFTSVAIRQVVRDPSTLPPEVLAEFVRESRRPGAGMGYARYNQATLGPSGMLNDLSDRVSHISVPTLFLHGALDPLVDPESSRRAAARMPDADRLELWDCGHWAHLEAHEEFLPEATAFLTSIPNDR